MILRLIVWLLGIRRCAIRTIDQIVSPIPEVGRPYEADPIELQEAAQCATRHGMAVP